MSPKFRAACLGEGLVVLVAREVGPLEDAGVFDRFAGGAEVNVAGVLAGYGVESHWVSRVGDDGFGRYLVGSVSERGIGVGAVGVDAGRPTGLYVKERGGSTGLPTDLGPGKSRMHYYRAGSAASAMDPTLLAEPSTAGVLATADLVHVTGITPALSGSTTDLTLALVSRPRSGLMSFDVNYRPGLWGDRIGRAADILAEITRHVDVALLGADEALAVWGIDGADAVRESFPEPRHLVVKNGGGAVSVFDGPERVDIDALSVQIVEQIGAGDAFAGGYLAGLLHGLDVIARTRLAHLSAAAVLTSQADHVALAWDDLVGRALECSDREWSQLQVTARGVPPALADLFRTSGAAGEAGREVGERSGV